MNITDETWKPDSISGAMLISGKVYSWEGAIPNIYIYIYPIPSMYGILAYIWLFLMVKYGKCR